MIVHVDFMLNRKFGAVERIIFRLVLNGFTDAREIANALPIFSDTVIANGVKRLVNRQVLSAEIDFGRLSLSEPVIAVIERCHEKTFQLDNDIKIENNNNGYVISSNNHDAAYQLKKAILNELVPGIKLDMLVDSLDFVIREERRDEYNG